MNVHSESPEQTVRLGRILGSRLFPGSVVLLMGDLGAGKTQFAKGVALGLGVEDHVTSPTFTIINEYEGRLPFYHVDAYRLEDEGEAYELGLEEYLYGAGVTLIEWPDRVEGILPPESLTVTITNTDLAEARDLGFTAVGPAYEKLLSELGDLL